MITKQNMVTSFFAGTFVYVMLSIFCGKDGIWAVRQLEEQKRLLSTHTDEIQKLNTSLELEYNALKNDSEVIAAFAKKLDYVSDGEKIVKINGLYSSDEFKYGTGTPLKSVEPVYLPEWFCKVIGLLCGGISLLYSVFSWIQTSASRKQKRVPSKGIVVYDMPQV